MARHSGSRAEWCGPYYSGTAWRGDFALRWSRSDQGERNRAALFGLSLPLGFRTVILKLSHCRLGLFGLAGDLIGARQLEADTAILVGREAGLQMWNRLFGLARAQKRMAQRRASGGQLRIVLERRLSHGTAFSGCSWLSRLAP